MKKVDQTFIDDPLRILRGIRQATIFGFAISPLTYEGMKRNVDRLIIISKERIQTELNNMLLSQNPTIALGCLREIGAMKYIIPELDEIFEIKQNKYHNYDTVWEHTMDVVDGLTGCDDLPLMVAALLHDIGKIKTRTVGTDGSIHFYQHELASAEMCQTILKRLKYSNGFINDVVFLVKNHMLTKQWNNDINKVKMKSLRKFQYRCGTFERFIRLMKLIVSDDKSSIDGLDSTLKNDNILLVTRKMMHQGTAMFGYKLPIDGNDVMEYMGLKPGREIKEYLSYLLKVAYSRPNLTKEECLKLIKNYKLK